MPTYTKRLLSGSTDGRGVKVVATATAGTTIHTATSTAGEIDFVRIWAQNISALPIKLTLEWGNASVDDNIELVIPGEEGMFEVVRYLPIANSLVVKAFAGTTNLVILHGDVTRYAP